ncbi:hypothetical protein ACIGEZ_30265 [Streptomyces sp. NPDC085481]|uniref:hypothetical protein n=1 Tax=Streptomyces sp. NPDC085481 TaxID=3365727 RepID=UPI0037CE0300
MDVFVCGGCGAGLTAPLTRVPLPAQAAQCFGHVLLPPLMGPGTYAVDPAPSGPPWRTWEELGEAEAAARGVFAPVYSVSLGAPGRIVVAPGDSRGTVLIQERCESHCMGLDGGAGPNLACEECGLPVATRVDDYGLWQAVWFEPDAVRRTRVTGAAPTVPAEATSPVDPSGCWSPLWEAAAGTALAHLLVASAGGPVALPDGYLGEMFGRAVATLLPSGPGARSVGLAGPGVPAMGVDIALVPPHPLTGEPWQPDGGAVPVPLEASVWAYLALPGEISPVPVSGTLPEGVLRDDYPLPLRPRGLFRPDRHVFRHTLARLPEVRLPWLRAIHDRAWDPWR